MRYPVSQPAFGPAETQEVLECMRSGFITQGSRVARFEERLSNYLGVPEPAVACSSGTAALHLALAALGIGPGDEVLVPALTYIATANAVCYVGARPVFVDVRANDWCIDLELAVQKLTDRTRAIIPVHLYGMPCDMDNVRVLAESFQPLYIIEDTAEGLGGFYKRRPLGTFGICGTFSFYGNKIITTGEGGAVTSSDPAITHRLRLLRGQAQGTRRFIHEEIGWNYRLTDLQAAIGLAQLERLSSLLAERHRVINTYRKTLRGVLEFPESDGAAPWLFTGLVPVGIDRDAVMQGLGVLGVETRPAFPAMHLQPFYQSNEPFPVATDISKRGISLPTYPALTNSEVQDICDLLCTVLTGVHA